MHTHIVFSWLVKYYNSLEPTKTILVFQQQPNEIIDSDKDINVDVAIFVKTIKIFCKYDFFSFFFTLKIVI